MMGAWLERCCLLSLRYHYLSRYQVYASIGSTVVVALLLNSQTHLHWPLLLNMRRSLLVKSMPLFCAWSPILPTTIQRWIPGWQPIVPWVFRPIPLLFMGDEAGCWIFVLMPKN